MKKQLPAPTGICWCGCGLAIETRGRYFRTGHDKRAEAMLLRIFYGERNPVAKFLVDRGYGPGGKNLKQEYDQLVPPVEEEEFDSAWDSPLDEEPKKRSLGRKNRG